jgi:hypothetical protein
MRLVHILKIISPVLIAAFALVGCSVSLEPPTLTPSPKFTLDLLKNAKYRYPIRGRYVQLANGIYQEREGFVTPTLMLFEQPLVFIDLNADEQEDAVVILDYLAGGSGKFRFLAVMINQNGIPTNVAITGLGDRTIVKNIHVQGNTITLDVLTQSMEDGMCCPTLNATWLYRFEDNKLIPLS